MAKWRIHESVSQTEPSSVHVIVLCQIIASVKKNNSLSIAPSGTKFSEFPIKGFQEQHPNSHWTAYMCDHGDDPVTMALYVIFAGNVVAQIWHVFMPGTWRSRGAAACLKTYNTLNTQPETIWSPYCIWHFHIRFHVCTSLYFYPNLNEIFPRVQWTISRRWFKYIRFQIRMLLLPGPMKTQFTDAYMRYMAPYDTQNKFNFLPNWPCLWLWKKWYLTR